MVGSLYVGTSGFAYKEWKPDFYPADLKSADFLRHYASRLTSVEINYTFRRHPSEKTVKAWIEQTPDDFRFACKAHQRITHIARLVDIEEPLASFLDSIAPLGGRMGPILFQCPPALRFDAEVIDGFLASLSAAAGSGPRLFAMEFRHESWRSRDVQTRLERAGVTLCFADTDEERASPATTTSFAYWRLRRSVYDAELLSSRAKEAAELLSGGCDVYVYFKHEDAGKGAAFGQRMLELLARG